MQQDLYRFNAVNNPDWLQINEDAAILFTTIDYPEGWGIAYQSSACSEYDQAIVQRPPVGYPSIQGFIVAHELGHLVGAYHTEGTNPDWYKKIMYPDFSPSSQMTFYAGSVLEIQYFVGAGAGMCIN